MAVDTSRPCWYCGVKPTVGEEHVPPAGPNNPVCATHKNQCVKYGKKVIY